MKITMYELLGLVKDGKAPKKIKYGDRIWEYVSTIMGTGYQYYSTFFEEWRTLQTQIYLEECLNDEVEIIEEPKKIEYEQIEELTCNEYDFKTKTINSLIKNQRKLIDEINNLKEND
nr:MAG TPA: hypothetical protein [Caudoviricetes sp.]